MPGWYCSAHGNPPTIEERITALEQELRGIGVIIRMESRLSEARFKTPFADIDTLKRDIGRMSAQLEALPRVISEMVAEVRRRRRK